MIMAMRKNGTNETHSSPALEYVSPSRLKLWLRCPESFRQRYVEGIVTPSNPKLFLGQVVHRALEFYNRYHQRGVSLYPEIVEIHIKKKWQRAVEEECIVFASKDEEQKLQAQAVELVLTYLGQPREQEAQTLFVEQRLEAPLIDPRTGEDLGISLIGIVDLVCDEGGGPCIVDFKTAARSSSQVDVIHELQMSCYSYLYRNVIGLREAGLEIRSLIKTKVPKLELHRFKPRQERDFHRLFAVIRAYLHSVRNNQFYIRPSMECSFCDFREWCIGNANNDTNAQLAQLRSDKIVVKKLPLIM